MPILLLACYSNFSFLFSLFIFPFLSSLLWGNIFTSLFGFLSVAAFLFSFYLVCSKNFCHICFHLELCDKGTAGSNSDDNDHIDFYFERATFILLERGEDWEIAPTSCRGTYRTPRSYFSLFLVTLFLHLWWWWWRWYYDRTSIFPLLPQRWNPYKDGGKTLGGKYNIGR